MFDVVQSIGTFQYFCGKQNPILVMKVHKYDELPLFVQSWDLSGWFVIISKVLFDIRVKIYLLFRLTCVCPHYPLFLSTIYWRQTSYSKYCRYTMLKKSRKKCFIAVNPCWCPFKLIATGNGRYEIWNCERISRYKFEFFELFSSLTTSLVVRVSLDVDFTN